MMGGPYYSWSSVGIRLYF